MLRHRLPNSGHAVDESAACRRLIRHFIARNKQSRKSEVCCWHEVAKTTEIKDTLWCFASDRSHRHGKPAMRFCLGVWCRVAAKRLKPEVTAHTHTHTHTLSGPTICCLSCLSRDPNKSVFVCEWMNEWGVAAHFYYKWWRTLRNAEVIQMCARKGMEWWK